MCGERVPVYTYTYVYCTFNKRLSAFMQKEKKHAVCSLPLILYIELPFSSHGGRRRFLEEGKVKENEILCHFLEGPCF